MALLIHEREKWHLKNAIKCNLERAKVAVYHFTITVVIHIHRKDLTLRFLSSKNRSCCIAFPARSIMSQWNRVASHSKHSKSMNQNNASVMVLHLRREDINFYKMKPNFHNLIYLFYFWQKFLEKYQGKFLLLSVEIWLWEVCIVKNCNGLLQFYVSLSYLRNSFEGNLFLKTIFW